MNKLLIILAMFALISHNKKIQISEFGIFGYENLPSDEISIRLDNKIEIYLLTDNIYIMHYPNITIIKNNSEQFTIEYNDIKTIKIKYNDDDIIIDNPFFVVIFLFAFLFIIAIIGIAILYDITRFRNIYDK